MVGVVSHVTGTQAGLQSELSMLHVYNMESVVLSFHVVLTCYRRRLSKHPLHDTPVCCIYLYPDRVGRCAMYVSFLD